MAKTPFNLLCEILRSYLLARVPHPLPIMKITLLALLIATAAPTVVNGKSPKKTKTKSSKSSKSSAPSLAPPPLVYGGQRLLYGGKHIEEDASAQLALDIIEHFKHEGVDPDATFSTQHDIISQQGCDALVEYTESRFSADRNSGGELSYGFSREMEVHASKCFARPPWPHTLSKKFYYT